MQFEIVYTSEGTEGLIRYKTELTSERERECATDDAIPRSEILETDPCEKEEETKRKKTTRRHKIYSAERTNRD